MKVYLFDEGMARFATKPYQAPKQNNLKDIYMHLTNYAINKLNNNYKENENEDGKGDSHKRSLTQIYEDIARKENSREKVEKAKDEIQDIIIKTLITGQPSLAHLFRSC
jgi:tubulin polyglutamylase TTLL6/13